VDVLAEEAVEMSVATRTAGLSATGAPPPAVARKQRGPGGAAGRVLALQRAAGNAAVSLLVEQRDRRLQRACCSACADGGKCESELLDEASPPGRRPTPRSWPLP
jgi:hypothetical protein